MRIAFFSNAYLPYLSGITLSIKTLRAELEKLGHIIFVVGPEYPGHKEADPRVLRLPSLPATYPGYRFVIPYSFKVFARLKEEKLDLVHAHQPFGVGLAALLFARIRKLPFVYTFHTLFPRYVHHAPFLPQRPAKRLITAYLTFFCRQADAIIVPSEMVRRYLSLQKVRRPIHVIPTGIELEPIREKKLAGDQRSMIRKKHRLLENAKILLYTGRLSEEKNVRFLLKAFGPIEKQAPDTYLILVGGGPKRSEYEKVGRSISPRIIFTGELAHSEVLDYCLGADLFVYASVTETQGLVLTEAKACGLPVVAVFGGGISDVVENGVDGYLVPQNQDKFVEHVIRLLKDPSLRKEMSVRAEEDARARFTSTSVAKRVESVYNSLIESKKGG